MKLVAADAQYRDALLGSTKCLASSLTACSAVPQSEWGSGEFTESIALRMQAWYHAQRVIQALLPKDLAAPASDAFVEAVAFFLRVFLAKTAPHLQVAAERKIGQARPDISVLREGDLVAVVECKTNLGRSRLEWEADFLERELQFTRFAHSPIVFLLVLTSRNWPGFGDDPRSSPQFFTLLDSWPSDLQLGQPMAQHVVHAIEPMFHTISQLPP